MQAPEFLRYMFIKLMYRTIIDPICHSENMIRVRPSIRTRSVPLHHYSLRDFPFIGKAAVKPHGVQIHAEKQQPCYDKQKPGNGKICLPHVSLQISSIMSP